MRESLIHSSLNRRKAVMGVPMPIFGMEALVVSLLLSAGLYPFLLVIVPIHLGARWMHTRDDGAFEGMFTYAGEKDVYDPWHRPSTTAKRPVGFGRDRQC